MRLRGIDRGCVVIGRKEKENTINGRSRKRVVAQLSLQLRQTILVSEATGGDVWNPLESGISVLLLGQMSRC
jgi:hypothetical protein